MLMLVGLTLAAGLAIPAGAAIGLTERILPRWLHDEFRHSVTAFGGGVLLSAVALVLVPGGVERLGWFAVTVAFVTGGCGFMLIDKAIQQAKGSAGQVLAMLADFVPEVAALGAVYTADRGHGLFLALIIVLQNLPEGFNSCRELRATDGIHGGVLIASLLGMSLLGPAGGLIGYYALADRPAVLAWIMLIAAGGIMYLTFQDIAPQVRLENKRLPALGSVLGFAAGLLGHMVIA